MRMCWVNNNQEVEWKPIAPVGCSSSGKQAGLKPHREGLWQEAAQKCGSPNSCCNQSRHQREEPSARLDLGFTQELEALHAALDVTYRSQFN